MILPSEALNREFVLDEDVLSQLVLDNEACNYHDSCRAGW